MSRSSNSDLEKETGFEKEVDQTRLSEEEEDITEASQPPFTTYDDSEKQRADVTEEPDGASLANVSSKPSVNNIKSVPNGGTKAWLQVLGVFFVFFNTWGIVNAVRHLLRVPSKLISTKFECRSSAYIRIIMKRVFFPRQILATSAG